jgi:outer membrane protein assembly factor BamB
VKTAPAALVYLAMLASTAAGDWPQWRGPDRSGISPEKISTSWPADGPKVLWQAAVGTGFSSISISQGRAYTLGNTANRDTIWCLNSITGKELWKHSYAAQLSPQWYEGGPGATPTVESNRVFTISKWGDIHCLDGLRGTVVWQRNLRELGLQPNRWGFAGSPLVWRDLVIFNAGAAGIALERDTGRVVWSSGTNAGGYASPTLFRSDDRDCVLIFAAKHLVARELESGRELWRQFWETGWDTNITDPLIHHGRIFISSFSRGCALLSVTDGKPTVVYDSKVLHHHLSPGILLGDNLYAFNGEAKQQTDFRCIHLPTGELKWTTKDPGFGSLICADGKLVVLSEKGELVVGEASPAEFRPLARAKVLSATCWTPPALANGLLYIRNARGELRCLDLREGKPESRISGK